ncbi:mRNA-decapping enzyme-like protein isoform X1 [Musa acuminata AAA Group]|uniref:mRNA-decapping enzyme-like protein isoform X1 n=1 Tax=Musa acuminata AAA Group TaxID=214697 RepID=UPI0008A0DF61|nr:PREDICTED: mRNA-decapping enzyme-like protein isoform X1 [Musa acuminata subsp. malaccensis]
MTQSGKLMPNLDQKSTKALNLTVLQRIDPFVEEILMTATHVTFYEFNIELNQWSRKDVEGSLFVIKRNAQPRFQFIVMNRRNTASSVIEFLCWTTLISFFSTFLVQCFEVEQCYSQKKIHREIHRTKHFWLLWDNLVEDLLGDFEYEVQVPYLLYRNAAQEVNGIWFYNSHDCEDIANLFSRILNAYSKVPPKAKVSSKSEFEELEAVPTSSVIEGPLEPTTSSNAAPIPDVPDDPFANFFSNAVNIGNASNATTLAVQPTVDAATIPVTHHGPFVNPSVVPTFQPTSVIPALSTLLVAPSDTLESSSGNSNRATNLVKPSFFSPSLSSSALVTPPVSSLTLTAPPVYPPVTMQHPYGTPLLQPFPPPTPSASLTPAPIFGPVITRDKVRDALLRLVQNNEFIEIVYRELLNAHCP